MQNDAEKFLDRFESKDFIERVVVRAYRGQPDVYLALPDEDKRPAKDVSQMFKRIEREIDERMGRDHESHKPDLAKLLEAIGDEDAIEFCRFIAKRENLPEPIQRTPQEIKADDFKNAAMSKRPPTIAQLEYLKSLGCEVRPGNQHEASILISRLKPRK